MKKVVRFFYLPTCPECFALVEKLRKIFADEEVFHFEVFDMVQDQLVSSLPWFPAEEEYLKRGW